MIDGETFKYVGIRGKGNTSLSTVSSLGSKRYSFKIEFDQYDAGKTYYGLDKLALNNLIQDSTMMKDYLAYTLMNEFGVDSPLCSFIYITVNGEDWGLYLAVEGVEDSFLERNYGAQKGELYKPDSLSFGGGRGNGKEFNMSEFWKENFEKDSDADETENDENTAAAETAPQGQSQMGGFDFGAGMPDMSGMPQMPGGEMPSGSDPGMMFGANDDEDGETAPQGGFPAGSFDPGAGMPDMSNMPQMSGGEMPSGFDPSSMPAGDSRPQMPGGGFGFGMGSSDVKLQYIDDDYDSYSNIWNNAKTEIKDSDKDRLIASLKKLSNNEDIESVVDIDQVIRYFVVHNFVCNGDSYTGMMIHNYYLHEKDGQLSMIPWDYNLAFGTMQGTDATGTINTPIDTPVSGGSSDRPMLNWIFENEEYTEMYHQYFAEFLETVDIAGIIDAAYELIAPYVEKDPTSFYTYEEFEKGVETIRQFCVRRQESIELQLENGETTTNMNYVDASDLTLSDMGSMNNGGPGGGGRNGGGMQMPGGRGDRRPGGSEGGTDAFGSGMPQMPGGFSPDSMPSGFDMTKMPEGFSSGMPQMPEGMGMPQMTAEAGSEMPQMPDVDDTKEPQPEATEESSSPEDACKSPDCETAEQPVPAGNGQSGSGRERPRMDGMSMTPPGGNGFSRGSDTDSASKTAYVWLGIAAGFLLAGLIIAKKFRD